MNAMIDRKRRLRGALRRFGISRRASAAIEFAIIAPVFFSLMFSMFEVGYFYFVNATVDSATTAVARYIRTGQAQKGGYKAQADRDSFFQNIVCKKLPVFGAGANCAAKVTVEVEAFSSFAALAADTKPATCRDSQPEAIDNLIFSPGQDRSIVRVRICLIYKTINPAIGLNLAKNDQGERRIISSYVLRVEPYTTGTGGASS